MPFRIGNINTGFTAIGPTVQQQANLNTATIWINTTGGALHPEISENVSMIASSVLQGIIPGWEVLPITSDDPDQQKTATITFNLNNPNSPLNAGAQIAQLLGLSKLGDTTIFKFTMLGIDVGMVGDAKINFAVNNPGASVNSPVTLFDSTFSSGLAVVTFTLQDAGLGQVALRVRHALLT